MNSYTAPVVWVKKKICQNIGVIPEKYEIRNPPVDGINQWNFRGVGVNVDGIPGGSKVKSTTYLSPLDKWNPG